MTKKTARKMTTTEKASGKGVTSAASGAAASRRTRETAVGSLNTSTKGLVNESAQTGRRTRTKK